MQNSSSDLRFVRPHKSNFFRSDGGGGVDEGDTSGFKMHPPFAASTVLKYDYRIGHINGSAHHPISPIRGCTSPRCVSLQDPRVGHQAICITYIHIICVCRCIGGEGEFNRGPSCYVWPPGAYPVFG